MTITFRALTTTQDLEQLPKIESTVWAGEAPIPLQLTLTFAKFGGIFLGAFDDDTMIGFLYSFPGYTDGQPHLCSHMMGFLPEYRKQGLGVQMKWLQLDEAIRRQHSKITWTYDPLESVNGFLNIAKLGGVVRTYLPNCYGEMNDVFNRGLPTDRFLVEWFIDSERVKSYREGVPYTCDTAGAPSLLHYKLVGDLPHPTGIVDSEQEPVLLIPVPAHFQKVKQADFGAATAWREMTSEVFQARIAQGYIVTNLLRDSDVVHYVLEKQPLATVLERR
ncbi:GNAT family N-acetyltransferase [Brevibacillus sp. TJ4]|uniref:GNAT family N-acetyltransferase n=1 Tax=Brevibacillus sp. TJ4 TaxID=3234853 RepID=UPI003BA146B5